MKISGTCINAWHGKTIVRNKMKNKSRLLNIIGVIGSIASVFGLVCALFISSNVKNLYVAGDLINGKINNVIDKLEVNINVGKLDISKAISNNNFDDNGSTFIINDATVTFTTDDFNRGENDKDDNFVMDMPNPYYIVELKVRNIDAGEKEFNIETTAKIGDTLEYQMYFMNSTKASMKDVITRAVLPHNMVYISDSTMLYNATNPSGIRNTDNTIWDAGINIGGYSPHGDAYVRYRAKVEDKNLVEGVNELYTWEQVGIDRVVFQEYATVIVEK